MCFKSATTRQLASTVNVIMLSPIKGIESDGSANFAKFDNVYQNIHENLYENDITNIDHFIFYLLSPLEAGLHPDIK